jgi:hypothetical protein
MRGPSNPSANTEISKPSGKVIDFPGTSVNGIAPSESGIAVGAGGSGSRLGPPMFNVQAPNNKITTERRFICITKLRTWISS